MTETEEMTKARIAEENARKKMKKEEEKHKKEDMSLGELNQKTSSQPQEETANGGSDSKEIQS